MRLDGGGLATLGVACAIGVAIGAFVLPSDDDGAAERTTTVQAPARTVTAPQKPGSDQAGCRITAFDRLRSRMIVRGVRGSVELRPRGERARMTINAVVPDRRFAVALYNSRSDYTRIVTGFRGRLSQTFGMPVTRVARYRYISILALVQTSGRRGRPREAVRTLARLRVGRLFGQLECSRT